MTDIVDKKYLNIQDVSQRTGVPNYTLRYWEKEFKQIKPERYSGIRKYSNADVEIINQIKDLLYNKKLTIKGVKKFLTKDRRKKMQNDTLFNEEKSINSKVLGEIKQELEDILKILEQ